MTDEKYLFVTDSIAKKRIGNSYRNRKTHTGRGGKVRLPHDNLTKKELEAMNGECKSYRLNDPMKWVEFKEMPDDLKIDYINLIRNAYGVSDNFMAKHLFKVSQPTLSAEMRRLGLGHGKNSGSGKYADNDNFLVWCNGVKAPAQAEPVEVDDSEAEIPCDVGECEPVYTIPVASTKAIPCSGDLTFMGAAENVLAAVGDILGGGESPHSCHVGSV